MAKREWMIEKRKRLGLTRERMARTIRKPGMWKCSEKLLTMLEEDDSMVTHPGVAEIIAEKYGATPEQAEGLLPKHRRVHDPEYEPGRYDLVMDWEHGTLPGGLSGRWMV